MPKKKQRVLLKEYKISPLERFLISMAPSKTLLRMKAKEMQRGERRLAPYIDKELAKRRPKQQIRWAKQVYRELGKGSVKKLGSLIERKLEKRNQLLDRLVELGEKKKESKVAETEFELYKTDVQLKELLFLHHIIVKEIETRTWAEVAEKGSEREIELMKEVSRLVRKEEKARTIKEIKEVEKEINALKKRLAEEK